MSDELIAPSHSASTSPLDEIETGTCDGRKEKHPDAWQNLMDKMVDLTVTTILNHEILCGSGDQRSHHQGLPPFSANPGTPAQAELTEKEKVEAVRIMCNGRDKFAARVAYTQTPEEGMAAALNALLERFTLARKP